MEVILLEKTHKLGNLGDKVAVKAGYGRNFLIPYGKAVPANKKNLADFEAKRAELEKKAAKVLQAAQKRAETMQDLTVTIEALASDEGKLFGSVGTNEIAEAIQKSKIAVEKREIRLPSGAIREIGEFDIDVELHSDIVVTVKVQVVAK